jgi:low affinity Fe/Cu permease
MGVKLNDIFTHIALKVSKVVGSAGAFIVAVIVIALWGITGPLFGFSDTWQLVINTATTIITFLMVFLIQNTQNREARSMELKLDELIHSSKARNTLINVEELSDEELDKLEAEFKKIVSNKTSKNG